MRHMMLSGLALAAVLAIFATPASAHNLTAAVVTDDCCSYTITYSTTDNSLTPGDTEILTCTFTLTPISGPPMTITCPTLTAVADTEGNLNAKSGPNMWLGSGCMTQGFTLSNGTATLVSPEGDTGSATITFNPDTVSSCTQPSGKTFHIGPSSMEGNLFIHAGDFVSGGYSFSFVDHNHPATTYTVAASVTVPVTCPQGGGPGGDITIDLGNFPYSVPAGNTNWLPTGDANSILSWQGSTVAPDLCGGNVMNNQHGAIFTSTVSQSPQAGLVNWRFKYRDPAAKGKPNTDCTNPNDPNRNRADVCGASWSQTVRDP
jgi:hypothetical protein